MNKADYLFIYYQLPYPLAEYLQKKVSHSCHCFNNRGEFEIPSRSKAGLRHCSSAEQSRKHVYELIMMIPGGLRAETAHFLKVLILGEVSSWKTFQYLGIDKTARTPDFPWEMYERKYEPLSLKLDVWTERIYFIFSVNLKWQHGRMTPFIELPG